MKNMKKVMALVLIAVMVFALSATALAQDVALSPADADNATITITNAAKGVTYKVSKLFDATVTGAAGGSIAYQGDIPAALSAYFTKDAATGAITATAALDLTNSEVQAAFKSWAEANVTNQAVSDGSALNFTGLPYGYYIITTTQGEALLTVDSTNPNATVIDKNSTPPISNLTKNAANEDENVSIGDTITYTVSFGTANYTENGQQILKYVIKDTHGAFIDNVTITNVTIGGAQYPAPAGGEYAPPAFDSEGKIEITWAENGQSLYDNGAEVVVTYTAVVTSAIEAGNVDTNENKITVDAVFGPGEGDKTTEEETETVYTYAAALQKVDENGAKLAGAKFSVKGLVVTGSAGNYTVVSYDPSANAADGTEMECDENGTLYIKGIASDETLVATETAAPDGYNMLSGTFNITPVPVSEKTTTTMTTTYYDAEGNVVDQEVEGGTTEVTYTMGESSILKIENQKGTELPETGGIGTRIFYIIGSVLILAAGVVLITRRRMNKD